MEFEITHDRDIIGNQIRVVVKAGEKQRILQVFVEADSSSIGSESLTPPVVMYARTWRKQGQAGPGRDHTVRVTATDSDGNQESAVEQWQDAS